MFDLASINGHGCIRMHKMNLSLIMRGHKLHLLTSKLTTFYEQYKTYNLCNDDEQIIESLRVLADSVQFLHAHNEPSSYISMWKEITSKPVIMDVHDSYLARITVEQADARGKGGKMTARVIVEERNNFQMADALIFPSNSIADLICNEFKLKQPRLVLPSYVPKQFYEYNPKEWLGGLCYEGRVALQDGSRQFQYCNYIELSDKCADLGVDFHLYSGRDLNEPRFKESYKSAFRHPGVRFQKLINKISRHDWGLVGNIFTHPEWDIAMPNKLFEYVAAGVPVCVMNAGEAAEFVVKTGIGIVVESIEELRDRWSEHRECRTNLFKIREQLSMDYNIGRLENFYTKVLMPGGSICQSK